MQRNFKFERAWSDFTGVGWNYRWAGSGIERSGLLRLWAVERGERTPTWAGSGNSHRSAPLTCSGPGVLYFLNVFSFFNVSSNYNFTCSYFFDFLIKFWLHWLLLYLLWLLQHLLWLFIWILGLFNSLTSPTSSSTSSTSTASLTSTPPPSLTSTPPPSLTSSNSTVSLTSSTPSSSTSSNSSKVAQQVCWIFHGQMITLCPSHPYPP